MISLRALVPWLVLLALVSCKSPPPIPERVPAPPPPVPPTTPRLPGTVSTEPPQVDRPPPAPIAVEPGAKVNPPRRSAGAFRQEVRELVQRLRSTPKSAEETFRQLWEVDRQLIPELLLEIENPETSQLRELRILIPDREEFSRRNVLLNAAGDGLSYVVPGMGTLQYDDLATGPARGRGLKLVLKRLNTSSSLPFTVGEVIRAAMLNRFRSSDYPPDDQRSGLVAWWQRYYERVRSSL